MKADFPQENKIDPDQHIKVLLEYELKDNPDLELISKLISLIYKIKHSYEVAVLCQLHFNHTGHIFYEYNVILFH